MRIALLITCIVSSCFSVACQAKNFTQGKSIETVGNILPQRERVATVNKIVQYRLKNLLPQLMQDSKLDMWLVINREYEEDPLFYSLVPHTTFAARRTTILVFAKNKQGKIERFTVSRYPIQGFYESQWSGGTQSQQWQRLAEIIRQFDPQRIGINTSKDWPLADGLTHGLYQLLVDAIGPKYQQRLVSAENLVVRWMETRTSLEKQIYPHIVTIARSVISEAFSRRVITPGVTTTDDVAWYIRQRFESLQLKPWFQPYVNIQRRGEVSKFETPFYGKSGVIRLGDVLHTDVGICYLKLCTDTQEMGYVLKLGESSPPKGLIDALAIGNRWQDILTREFKTGRSGNEIFSRALAASKEADIHSSIYTHPIGIVGHAVGPTIGMWDKQASIPVKGDWKLYKNTAFAIEGNVKVLIPEWNKQWLQIKLEQTAIFDGNSVYYLGGRQTKWHLIK